MCLKKLFCALLVLLFFVPLVFSQGTMPGTKEGKAKLIKELLTLEMQLLSLRNQIATYKTSIEDLQTQIQELNNHIKVLQSQTDSDAKNLSELKRTLEEQTQLLTESKKALMEQIQLYQGLSKRCEELGRLLKIYDTREKYIIAGAIGFGIAAFIGGIFLGHNIK